MGETLTQRQIDRLFEGGDPREETRPVPIPYSFRRPPMLPKALRLEIGARLEAFAQALHLLLTLRLRKKCEASVLSVEQATYSEFVFSLQRPCAALVLTMHQHHSELGVLDLGIEFSSICVDRILGGEEQDGEPKKLTRLEQSLIGQLAEEIVAHLREAFRGFESVAPVIRSFESDPESLASIETEDSLLAAILEVKIGERHAVLTLGIPMGTLRRRESAVPAPGPAPAVDRERLLETSPLGPGIRRSLLEIAVRLPTVSLTAAQISGLEVGSVIDTTHRTERPIELSVNGRVTHLGMLGQVHGKLGLEIAGPAEGSGEPRSPKKRRGVIL